MTSFITVILRQSFIVPTPSLSSVSALSNHSVFHIGCCVLCRVLSCAPTAPALPPDNPALSSYIPRSDYGLYYCSLLSAPTNIPNLSDFVLPCPFRIGLFHHDFSTQPHHDFLFHITEDWNGTIVYPKQ